MGDEKVDPGFAAGGGREGGGGGAVVQRGGLFLLHRVGVEVARLFGLDHVDGRCRLGNEVGLVALRVAVVVDVELVAGRAQPLDHLSVLLQQAGEVFLGLGIELVEAVAGLLETAEDLGRDRGGRLDRLFEVVDAVGRVFLEVVRQDLHKPVHARRFILGLDQIEVRHHLRVALLGNVPLSKLAIGVAGRDGSPNRPPRQGHRGPPR